MKKQKSKRKTFITFIAVISILQSCSVMNLSYNTAKLQEGYSYEEIELHGSNYMKAKPINWDLSVGYVNIYKPGLDYYNLTAEQQDNHSYNPEDLSDQNYSALKLGITPTYYFSKSRFQPFIGCGFNAAFFSPRQTAQEGNTTSYAVDSYLFMVPDAGLRLFLSKKFGIHAKAGYSFGKINNPAISISSASGLLYSFGLTLTF